MHSESFSPSAFSLFRCHDCGKINRFSDFPHPESDMHTLIAVLSGEVCVHVSGQSHVLSKHTFAVWEEDKITIDDLDGKSTVFYLFFSGALAALFGKLKLSAAVPYNMQKEHFGLFGQVLTEYQQGIETGSDILFTARMLEIFSLSARELYNRFVPSDHIGIHVFSEKGIAKREEGIFHGRKCIKITPNRDMKTIIVLENFTMETYHINPLHHTVMQMQYYYESRGTRPIEARFRTLSCIDEADPERKAVFMFKNGGCDFFAPLRRNRWSSAFFTLQYSPEARAVPEAMLRPVLHQVKLDPFGIIDASSIEDGDVCYIASVVFYSNFARDALPGMSPIEAVRLLIDENYRRELPLSFYADACHFSVRHLITRFTREVGISPHRYILQKRIAYARSYLSEDMPIAQIAQDAGFSDPHYFSRIFKKITGLTPTEYRAAAKRIDSP